MASKSTVTKFFQDNHDRLSAHSDPIAYNTNGGLYALTEFLAEELQKMHTEIKALNRKIDQVEHELRRQR